MARPTVQKAKERYRSMLNKQLPDNKTRDIKPSKSSLMGCLSLKFAIAIVIGIYLTLYSMGYVDSQIKALAPFDFISIAVNISVGFAVYFILTIFTEIYISKKSGLIGTIALIVAIALIVGVVFYWSSIIGDDLYALHITVPAVLAVLLGVICLIWDFVNLSNLNKNNPGK